MTEPGLRYLSVCSGIEAASVAWHPLEWKPLAFSEIEPFPRAVLAHRYPNVPCHGDFTKLRDMDFIVDADVLVGGTPCQAFSVAGLRNSLADDRGNLSLEYVRLADAIDTLRLSAGRKPAVILWENVPGVLSVKDNAFGCFLAALAGDVAPYVPPRGKWTDAGVVAGPQRTVAWRILDAQYFGLAQRRRRVFVVASAREGFDPAAVLLECEGVRRDTPPRREAGETASARATGRAGERSHWDGIDNPHPTLNQSHNTWGVGQSNQEIFSQRGAYLVGELAPTLDATMDRKWGSNQWVNNGFAVVQPVIMSSGQANAEIRTDGGAPALTCLHEAPIVAHTLKGEGFDASEDGTGRGTPLVPVAFPANLSATQCATAEDIAPSMGAKNPTAVAYAFQPRIARNGRGDMGEVVNALNAQSGETGKGDAAPCVAVGFQSNAGSHGGDIFSEMSPTLRVQKGGGSGMPAVAQQHMAVRRLTPVECERLQGFPDNYTLIPWRNKAAADCPDGPRYKALGNSMAVPVMRWIGQRIWDHIKGAQ